MKQVFKFTFLVALLSVSVLSFAQPGKYPFEFKKTGRGLKTIIFIPGFACSGDVWNETRAAFEKKYTCYTLTMAGFAGVPPERNSSFRSWEEGIALFIEQNKIDRPIIIGHSMGGGLALALAADYPQLVSKIVVVDALPCLAAMMDTSFKAKENNDCSAMITKMTSLTDEQFQQQQMQTIPRLLADASKKELVVSWSVKSDRKTFAGMYCDFSNTDLRVKIANIKCPSLILLESYFANIKPIIEQQYKYMTTANLQYASKGLHFLMYDDTEWYMQQLNSFLK